MAVKPVVISDEAQLIGLLRGRREGMGLSQGEADDRIGWPDGYLAKVEAPDRKYGRRVFWMSSFCNWWLEAMGLTLVLMETEQAQALIAGTDAPAIGTSEHRAYPHRDRARPVVTRRTVTTHLRFTSPG